MSYDSLYSEESSTPLDFNTDFKEGLGKKAPVHLWTREERKVLCISRLWFKSTENTDEHTFTAIKRLLIVYFASTTGGSSLQHITTGAVTAQCNEIIRMRKEPWDKIMSKSREELDGPISCLQKIIDKNDLDLVERAAKYLPSPRAPLVIRQTQRQESCDDDYERCGSLRRPRRSHVKSLMPANRGKKYAPENSPLSPLRSPLAGKSEHLVRKKICKFPLSSASSLASPSPLPTSRPNGIGVAAMTDTPRSVYKYVLKCGKGDICYRFWDDNSHVKLGSNGFLAPGAIDGRDGLVLHPPPETFSQEFRATAKAHLTMKHSVGGSPFISIVRSPTSLSSYDAANNSQWESLLPAIHRAIRSESNSFIAVINAEQLSLCQSNDYPDILPSPLVLRDLKEQGELPSRFYHGLSRSVLF